MINPSSNVSSFTHTLVLLEEAHHHHLSLRFPSHLRIPPILPDTVSGTIGAIFDHVLHARLLAVALFRLDDKTAATGVLEVGHAHAVKACFGDWLGAEDVWIGDAGVFGGADGVVDDGGGVAGDAVR